MTAKDGKQNHIGFLDHFRGVAILAVFMGHALNVSLGEDFDRAGETFPAYFIRVVLVSMHCLYDAGVPIFFVVSGFCIHMSYQQQGRNWAGFFIRRFFRIYPPYLFAVLFFAVIYPLTRFDIFRGWQQMVYHLLLIHNLRIGAFSGINPSFWSIGVEVQLYLLYPALLWLASRLSWRLALGSLALLELGMRAACIIHPRFLGDYWFIGSPFYFWFSWSLGAAMADAHLQNRPLPLAKFSPALWLALAAFCHYARPLQMFVFPAYAVLTTIILGRMLTRNGFIFQFPQFCRNHLRITGVCSYSIYLLHQPLLASVSGVLHYFYSGAISPMLVYVTCVLSWLVIMPLGWLCWRLLELPSIACGKQIIRGIQRKQP
jgi:peptidoglycan/LPS O-acetylase OafA/YrhL